MRNLTKKFTWIIKSIPLVLLLLSFGYGSSLDVNAEDEGVKIDENSFPDYRFRSYVSSDFDTDKDGYLSDSEISAVTSIRVQHIPARRYAITRSAISVLRLK